MRAATFLFYHSSAGSCTFRFCAGSQHTSSSRLPAGRAVSGFAVCQQRLSTAAATASYAPGSSVHSTVPCQPFSVYRLSAPALPSRMAVMSCCSCA